MSKLLRLAALAAAVAAPVFAHAANHFVRAGATGNGSGSDWTNAYTTLPANLVRGDTYYLAGGNYGSHTFQDADSGTQTISIVRATAMNHGTDVGWQTAYNQGSAIFTHWNVITDYYVFDGQRRNPDWNLGTFDQYGIRVIGANTLRLDDNNGKGTNFTTFRYVDFQGGGRDTGYHDSVVYGLTGNSNMTWQYCALHDSDLTIFFMRGNWQNDVIDHTYIARNTSTPTWHGEGVSMMSTNNITWSNNVMEDIEGTAFIAGIGNGMATNWRIFGNVAVHTAAYIARTGRQANYNFGVSGFVFIAYDRSNQVTGNNWQVYNNSFVNIQGTLSGVFIQNGANNMVRNNIWYSSVHTGTNLGANWTFDHNWYYNTSQSNDLDKSTVTCTTNCDIFMSVANRDFRLKASLQPGATLAGDYAVDMAGVTRGVNGVYDRGAFQFKGTALSNVGSPKQLIVGH